MKILIIQVVYNNELCMQQYETTKNFYKQFPNVTVVGLGAKGYGDNTIIKVTDKDKETAIKWYEFCKCTLMNSFDVYIRLTPSTLLNMQQIVDFVNSDRYDNKTVYTGHMFKYLVENKEPMLFARGNFIMMSKCHMKSMHKICKTNQFDKLISECAGICDDSLIGHILFDLCKYKYCATKMMAIDEPNVEKFDLSELSKTTCIVYKCFETKDNIHQYVMNLLHLLIYAMKITKAEPMILLNDDTAFRNNIYKYSEGWMKNLCKQHFDMFNK